MISNDPEEIRTFVREWAEDGVALKTFRLTLQSTRFRKLEPTAHGSIIAAVDIQRAKAAAEEWYIIDCQYCIDPHSF
jgi:hypothetical protein